MLNAVALPAGTSWTQIYPAASPSGKAVNRTIAEVSLCNGPASNVNVGLALTTNSTAPTAGASTPASGSCGVLEFNRALGASGVPGNGPLTRSVTVLPGQFLWAQASATGVSAVVSGIEE